MQLEKETVWLSLDQMGQLFGRDKSTISRHVKNVFKEGELMRPAVVANNATTAADGKIYQVEYFNLDDTCLAALTLLVAESAPAQKETLIRLIMNMLASDEKITNKLI